MIESIFRAGRFSPGQNKPPPPVIIKFLSSAPRLAIFKNKKLSMPKPNESEVALGIKRFIITEDLTTATYRKYQEILQHERVSRAWTIDGVIYFVPVGDGKSVKKVKSVFEDTESIVP